VSKDGSNWTKINIPIWPNKRWNFVTCEIDLSAYASSTMQFMFEYISTNSYAGTWEVKNVVVEALTSPENYCPYEALEGLTSSDLRTALHEATVQHTKLSYDQIRGDRAKVDVRSNGKIWDIYSAYSYNLSDYCSGIDIVEGECYNREHILPKSWWGGSTSEPMYTDLHHVYSVDAMANDKRSAWIYDEVKYSQQSHKSYGKTGLLRLYNKFTDYLADVKKGSAYAFQIEGLQKVKDEIFDTINKIDAESKALGL
jgi:endonuclease I